MNLFLYLSTLIAFLLIKPVQLLQSKSSYFGKKEGGRTEGKVGGDTLKLFHEKTYENKVFWWEKRGEVPMLVDAHLPVLFQAST